MERVIHIKRFYLILGYINFQGAHCVTSSSSWARTGDRDGRVEEARLDGDRQVQRVQCLSQISNTNIFFSMRNPEFGRRYWRGGPGFSTPPIAPSTCSFTATTAGRRSRERSGTAIRDYFEFEFPYSVKLIGQTLKDLLRKFKNCAGI